MSDDGSQSPSDGQVAKDAKGRLNPFMVTAPGAGPSPPNQGENRVPVFPSSQSDPNVFRQEDPNQTNRQLTPSSANINVTFRTSSGGPDGVTADGDRRTITKPEDAPEAFPAGIVPDDAGAGSPFGVGPQSEALMKRSRVVVNPKAKGEEQH